MWTAWLRPLAEKTAAREGMTARERFDEMVKTRNPMKRAQTPEDMGNLTAFLVSDDSCNITGQTINIDSGGRLD